MPSVLGKRRRVLSSRSSGNKQKLATWDRTIICLPKGYIDPSEETISIPRKMRSVLAKYGLIGMIHLEYYWDQDELFAEVRSVFKDAMNDPSFSFLFLVPTGGGSKSLTKPVLSSNFKWTPKQVAGKADSIIYILAERDLKNEVQLL